MSESKKSKLIERLSHFLLRGPEDEPQVLLSGPRFVGLHRDPAHLECFEHRESQGCESQKGFPLRWKEAVRKAVKRARTSSLRSPKRQ